MHYIAAIDNFVSMDKDVKLILASNSPRRKELLKQITLEFLVVPSNYDEEFKRGMTPYGYVLSCAKGKALDVLNYLNYHSEYNKESHPFIIIAADTIVVTKDSKILLKPQNEKEAFNMLKELSNNWHRVSTAVCVKFNEKTLLKYKSSYVRFNEFEECDIMNYIKSGSPFDKAGGYGVQDEWIKARVARIDGSIDNIMGLPLKQTKKMLKEVLE